MMKNGLRSNNPQNGKLELIDCNGHVVSRHLDEDGTSVEYQIGAVIEPDRDDEKRILNRIGQIHQSQLIAFTATSIGCAAAAVATGSYAIWLSRRKVTQEALISVHDLLETCRERVSRMEAELNRSASRS